MMDNTEIKHLPQVVTKVAKISKRKKQIELKRVFHFSGGASSGYMVLKYFTPGDIVIFCDTTREDDDTYRFVRDFEKENNIPIVWLGNDWRRDVIVKEKMIPNRFKRKCTINLKIKRARRYLRSIGLNRYTQFIGFRYDEQSRVKSYFERWIFVETVFPLYRDKIEKPEILLFWKPLPYRLKIPSILGNCDLCFQKGESAVIAIIKDDPTRADKWIEDEENQTINPNGYTYFKNSTMRQLRAKALAIGKPIDLNNISSAFTCSCTA